MMKHSSGVTLLEMVMVIVLLGAITASGGDLLLRAVSTHTMQNDILNASWQARIGFMRMERSIADAAQITAATSSSISFIAPDGTTDTYTTSGTTLTLNGAAMATDISALTLTYLTNSFAMTTTAADVRCVVIDATVENTNANIDIDSVVCPRALT